MCVQFLVFKALDPDWIRIRIGVHPKMLDPDPDEMNKDPQPWSYRFGNCRTVTNLWLNVANLVFLNNKHISLESSSKLVAAHVL
jgi:hypothetical protein